MSGFIAAGDAVSEALAAFTAAELEEPADVEESVRAVATWAQDVAYAIRQTAAKLEVTGIRPAIWQRMFASTGGAHMLAEDLEELTGFTLAHGV